MKMITLAIELLESQPALYMLSEDMPDQVDIGTTCYLTCTGSDMNGFYDWLRNHDKKVIGVRMIPTANEPLYRTLKDCSYVDWNEAHDSFTIFFSTEREYMDEYSADQDFGNNKLLRSMSDTYMISFNCDGLSGELMCIQPVRRILHL